MSEFNLNKKIRYCSDDATRKTITGLKQRSNHTGYIKVFLEKDVKGFIKEINGKMQDRLEFLSQFDGLGEVMLQKSEISNIKRIIDKLAGSKLADQLEVKDDDYK